MPSHLPLNFGLIGCGAMGEIHVRCVQPLEHARFTAYADTHLPAARKMLNRHGGRYATVDASRILDDPDIDAVYICTRHDSHARLAIQALAAGKHVMIEKPLALTVEECEAVALAARRSSAMLMPAFKLRFYPLIQQARAFIPEPVIVAGQMMDDRWPDDQWIQHPIHGGANVRSQGCHTTDIIRYLAHGEPQSIFAMGGTFTHPGHPCLDHCAASIHFDNGCIGHWLQGDAAAGRFTGKFFFQIFGHNRSVQIHDRGKQAVFYDGQRSWTLQRDEEEGMAMENLAFIQAIRQGSTPPVTVHDAVQATRIVEHAALAIQTGRVQHFVGETGHPHPTAAHDNDAPSSQPRKKQQAMPLG